jgi:hypothetical protein
MKGSETVRVTSKRARAVYLAVLHTLDGQDLCHDDMLHAFNERDADAFVDAFSDARHGLRGTRRILRLLHEGKYDEVEAALGLYTPAAPRKRKKGVPT